MKAGEKKAKRMDDWRGLSGREVSLGCGRRKWERVWLVGTVDLGFILAMGMDVWMYCNTRF
jgi:hypothetical protein